MNYKLLRIMFTIGNIDRYIGRHSGRHSIDTRSTLGRLSIVTALVADDSLFCLII